VHTVVCVCVYMRTHIHLVFHRHQHHFAHRFKAHCTTCTQRCERVCTCVRTYTVSFISISIISPTDFKVHCTTCTQWCVRVCTCVRTYTVSFIGISIISPTDSRSTAQRAHSCVCVCVYMCTHIRRVFLGSSPISVVFIYYVAPAPPLPPHTQYCIHTSCARTHILPAHTFVTDLTHADLELTHPLRTNRSWALTFCDQYHAHRPCSRILCALTDHAHTHLSQISRTQTLSSRILCALTDHAHSHLSQISRAQTLSSRILCAHTDHAHSLFVTISRTQTLSSRILCAHTDHAHSHSSQISRTQTLSSRMLCAHTDHAHSFFVTNRTHTDLELTHPLGTQSHADRAEISRTQA